MIDSTSNTVGMMAQSLSTDSCPAACDYLSSLDETEAYCKFFYGRDWKMFELSMDTCPGGFVVRKPSRVVLQCYKRRWLFHSEVKEYDQLADLESNNMSMQLIIRKITSCITAKVQSNPYPTARLPIRAGPGRNSADGHRRRDREAIAQIGSSVPVGMTQRRVLCGAGGAGRHSGWHFSLL